MQTHVHTDIDIYVCIYIYMILHFCDIIKQVIYRCCKNYDNDAFFYDLLNAELCNNLIKENGDVEQAWLNRKTEFLHISNQAFPH